MNGQVDRAGRALLTIKVRPTRNADDVDVVVWIDTAFTGELVIPRPTIERLGLSQSSAIMAGLADGTKVLLETYSCVVEWFGDQRLVEVVESDGQLPLLGVGLLKGNRLEVDYRLATLRID